MSNLTNPYKIRLTIDQDKAISVLESKGFNQTEVYLSPEDQGYKGDGLIEPAKSEDVLLAEYSKLSSFSEYLCANPELTRVYKHKPEILVSKFKTRNNV